MYDTQISLADTNSIQIQPTLIYLVLHDFVKRNMPTITSSLGNLNYYRFTEFHTPTNALLYI